jgi:hypothetical protein
MVTSSAYRMSSRLRGDMERLDPQNELLHRMAVRRLEAEEIRDALLAVSGRLDPQMFGPGVLPHLSPFMNGRGRPEQSGPLDGNGRRSIYLNIRRNFLDPTLLAFDAPVPFSTMGRRNVSNVPAQALALWNAPLITHLADLWASRVCSQPEATDTRRIESLYESAFGRAPTAEEMEQCSAFLTTNREERQAVRSEQAWAELCHVLMNVKEFIYVE